MTSNLPWTEEELKVWVDSLDAITGAKVAKMAKLCKADGMSTFEAVTAIRYDMETKKAKKPSALDAFAEENTPSWTEEELVAWVKKQNPKMQAEIASKIKEYRRRGMDPVIFLTKARVAVEAKQADESGLKGLWKIFMAGWDGWTEGSVRANKAAAYRNLANMK